MPHILANYYLPLSEALCSKPSTIIGESEMGLVLIACYKPKEGKEEELYSLIKTHAELIKQEGLATNRESILMKSKDNSMIEVSEWKSKEAIRRQLA